MSIVKVRARDMDLWKPQREGLEVFDQVTTSSPIGRGITKKQILGTMMVGEPSVSFAVALWEKEE